jgi:signal peptidase II
MSARGAANCAVSGARGQCRREISPAESSNPLILPLMRKLILFITLPLFVLDILTKQYIVSNFPDPEMIDPGTGRVVPVIDGFFSIVRVHNRGVAFGLGNHTEWANVVFGCVTVAALALIWWLCRTNAFPTKTSKVAVALLLSGVFGNLLDRFLRGYVVDFLHFYVGERQWPSFNVADSCICIAAGLLFISAFQKAPVVKPKEQNA